MNNRVDVAIIGGGAAGLAAAIFAAEAAPRDARIAVLDGARTLGAKILVSGGGRCNVTHDSVRPEDFNGPRNIIRNVLAAFPADATVRWFKSLDVKLKREETGKLFPVTDSARTVLNALLGRIRELGVELELASRVSAINPPRFNPLLEDHASPFPSPDTPGEGAFSITHSNGSLLARRVILSAGGRSLPRSGSDGSGWDMVGALGHTVSPTYPALVPLVLDARMFHAQLAGISQDVELTTLVDGKRIDRRSGSLLWTHFGISGPVVMDASRYWIIARETGQNPQLLCNLLGGENFEATERWLIDQAAQRARSSIGSVLSQRLPERVAIALAAYAAIDASIPMAQLSREARRTLVHHLTALALPVLQARGWNYAEVTAGGVPLAEIDYRTMQSRICPGLFLAGEILDCDGRIGGFNFQWAWATGHLAGRAAVK